MLNLVGASLFFILIHLCVSGLPSVRAAVAGQLGEGPYRAVFSIASILGLWWMASSYGAAPHSPLWSHSAGLAHLSVLMMPISVYLVVGAFTQRNPTSVGQERALSASASRGILTITRHPFLWGVTLWALAHILANPDVASSIFFGTFLLVAVAGTRLIDRRYRRNSPAAWVEFANVTSNVPLVALLRGKTRARLSELFGWRLALAMAIFFALLWNHAWLFGVSPLP